MGRTEVGAVAAEDVDPLAAGVVGGLGDQVGDVAFAAAGHPDVRRGGAGVLADEHVRGRDGRALGAVRRGRVGELDVLAHVVGGQGAAAGVTDDLERAPLGVDDRPQSPGWRRRASVSLRRVAIRSPTPIRSPAAVTRPSEASPVPTRTWWARPLIRATCSRVSATTSSPRAARTASAAVPLDLAGVHDHEPAPYQLVEDLTRSAHHGASAATGRRTPDR